MSLPPPVRPPRPSRWPFAFGLAALITAFLLAMLVVGPFVLETPPLAAMLRPAPPQGRPLARPLAEEPAQPALPGRPAPARVSQGEPLPAARRPDVRPVQTSVPRPAEEAAPVAAEKSGRNETAATGSDALPGAPAGANTAAGVFSEPAPGKAKSATPGSQLCSRLPQPQEKDFPSAASEAGVAQGHVAVRLRFDEQGWVKSVDVIGEQPKGYFALAAKRLARGWRCEGLAGQDGIESELRFRLEPAS